MASEITAFPSRGIMDAIDKAKQINAAKKEYWYARQLARLLGYVEWRNFENAIARARASCEAYGQAPAKHFVATSTMVEVGSGARRKQRDFFLSRYACRLIAMNGDPSKTEIASAQAYFVTQTHRMEQVDQMEKDVHRLTARERVSNGVKRISDIAHDIGVERFGLLHAARWLPMYDKPNMAAIREAKGLEPGEDVLNRLGAWELSAHDFAIGMAAQRLLDESVTGEKAAISVQREVAQSVRRTIVGNLGYGPEKLPAEEPIKAVKKRVEQGRKARQITDSSD